MALVAKVAVAPFALPVTCLTLCTLGVQPVYGWMMRHHCPFAEWAMHPPSRPMGEAQTSQPMTRDRRSSHTTSRHAPFVSPTRSRTPSSRKPQAR